MLISQRITEAIHEQIGMEFGAMLQYTAISAYLAAETLPELAAHFAKQAEEEKGHAHKFIKYLVDTAAPLAIPAMDAPKIGFKHVEDAVKLSLDQEIKVTKAINNLVAIAKEERDFLTDRFLQWFVEEQLEEVSSMQDLLRIVQRAGESNLLRVEEYLAREKGNVSGSSSGED